MKHRRPPYRPALWVLALATLSVFGTGALAGTAEDIQQAEAASRSGDFSTAMVLFRKAADQNHPFAQARLADLLHAAEFDQEALVLYRKGAQQGEPAAEYGLGMMYANGTGVARDNVVALEWLRKAEKQNYAPAVDTLARAYRAGDFGLPKDPDPANALQLRLQALQAAGREAK
jgi:uncharacterized protein